MRVLSLILLVLRCGMLGLEGLLLYYIAGITGTAGSIYRTFVGYQSVRSVYMAKYPDARAGSPRILRCFCPSFLKAFTHLPSL